MPPRRTRQHPPKEFFVLLREEFGYAYYFWVPGMSEEALVAWWRSVPAAEPGKAPLFFRTANLPGRKIPIDQEAFGEALRRGGCWYAHVHWDDDSYLNRPDGTLILHQGHPDADDMR